MKLLLQKTSILFVLAAVSFTGCDEGGGNGPAPVEAQMAEDIPGNVPTTVSTTRGPVTDVNDHPDTESDVYTFYDLETGATVSDSSSAEWDIAFSGTTVLANSGNGGGIQVIDGAYADIEEAPTTGFSANIGGSGSWYTYTGMSEPQHAILPIEEKTIIVETPDGQYAKVQILSYYEGNPDTSSEEFANMQTRPASGYFTFNYTLKLEEGNTELFHEEVTTYFDLESGTIVEDESSAQWDLGFSGTTIIANADNGGGIQSLNIEFSALDEAPVEGYAASNSDWYTYTGNTPPTHAVLPVEGLTLVVQTPDGNYAKVRMISYYEGNPDTSTEEFSTNRSASRYFTFEYAVQADGSVNFE